MTKTDKIGAFSVRHPNAAAFQNMNLPPGRKKRLMKKDDDSNDAHGCRILRRGVPFRRCPGAWGKFHLIRRKQFPLEIVFATFPYEGKVVIPKEWPDEVEAWGCSDGFGAGRPPVMLRRLRVNRFLNLAHRYGIISLYISRRRRTAYVKGGTRSHGSDPLQRRAWRAD